MVRCSPWCWAGEQAAIFEPLIASGKVDELADPSQAAGLRAAMDIAAKDYLKAQRIRRLIQREFAKLFTAVDVLLAPGRSGAATPADQPLDRAPSFQVPPGTPPGLTGLIPAGNLAGLPALVLPCGVLGQAARGAAGGRAGIFGKRAPGCGPRISSAHGLAHSAARRKPTDPHG